MLTLLGQGFERMLDPWLLLMCFAGTFAGTLVGVLPGLGPSAAIAVLLPLTYYGADPLVALVSLAGNLLRRDVWRHDYLRAPQCAGRERLGGDHL